MIDAEITENTECAESMKIPECANCGEQSDHHQRENGHLQKDDPADAAPISRVENRKSQSEQCTCGAIDNAISDTKT
jgi:hypothetical protein